MLDSMQSIAVDPMLESMPLLPEREMCMREVGNDNKSLNM